MPKTAAEIKANNKWNRKTYKELRVFVSISDSEILKQYCSRNGNTISNYFYELAIKDMATKGIKLQGTATRNVDDIISSGKSDNNNNTSIQDSDVDV